MFRKIDKTSTFNDVLKQIIENIQNGELQPGDALPAERILAEEFGISRPALREVLKALSLLGITVSVHGGANYIATDLYSCLTEPLSIIFQMYNSKIQDALQLRAHWKAKLLFSPPKTVHRWMLLNSSLSLPDWTALRMKKSAVIWIVICI